MIEELSKEIKKDLEKLIINKKFSEIEIYISSLEKKYQETPFILNLLGVCKVSKKTSNIVIFDEFRVIWS